MIFAFFNRFLHWMILGLLTPVLVLLMISKGATIETVGFIMAILAATTIIFEVPSGILSDLIGRKRLYMIALAIMVVAIAVLISFCGFWAVVAGFSLFGLARAFSSGSIESDILDSHVAAHGAEKLHEIVTVMNSGEIVGLAFGSLLGGLLPTVWHFLFPGTNQYDSVLFAQLAIVAIVLGMTTFFKVPIPAERHPEAKTFITDLISVLQKDYTIIVILTAMALWGFSFAAIETYWQPFLIEILGSETDLWIFGLVNCGYFAAALIGSLIAGRILSETRIPKTLLIVILKIAIAVIIAALSFQTSFPGFAVIYIALMGLNGTTNVPENTLLNERIPTDKRASLLSIASLSTQTGGIVAYISFSLIKHYTSIATIWLIAAAIFLLSPLLYLGLRKHEHT